MATGSFSQEAFSTGAFSELAFDFSAVAPPPQTASTLGWASGAYVTQMTEAEFQRRRRVFLSNMHNIEYRMKIMAEAPKLHAAMIADAAETFEEMRKRERRLSNNIAKQILREHAMEVRSKRKAAAIEADDERTIIEFFQS